ncbi:hypothetical protein CI102_5645 [Trichoderma harzianum]|nr:hypothetical protein CI102_5645 [Trichoderma harzianum]
MSIRRIVSNIKQIRSLRQNNNSLPHSVVSCAPHTQPTSHTKLPGLSLTRSHLSHLSRPHKLNTLPSKMAPISLSIRKATPADLAPVLALVRSAYRGESSRAGWTTEAELVDDQRIDEEGLVAKINEPFGAVLVAQDEAGDILACCEVLKQSDTVGYFGLFAVNPLRQAGGIGRTVLTAAEEYAKQTWGLTEMEMTVIWTREELIQYYIRRGYTLTEKTKPFPYAQLVGGKALRDDLYFSVLIKAL